jgi:hypothetical protein
MVEQKTGGAVLTQHYLSQRPELFPGSLGRRDLLKIKSSEFIADGFLPGTWAEIISGDYRNGDLVAAIDTLTGATIIGRYFLAENMVRLVSPTRVVVGWLGELWILGVLGTAACQAALVS